MQPSLYVALSGQIALQKRLETIAHNLANTNTAGFRAEEVKFSTIVSDVPPDPAAFASSNGNFIARRAGEFVQTENPFDIAVQGDAWLSIDMDGQQVYTRDGRMKMSDQGELQTLNGHPVLDAGGAPLQLDPNGGEVSIAPDGTVTQNGRQLGALGLFTIAKDARLQRYENAGVVPDIPAEPALDFSRNGVAQGFIEQSNVNPVSEITKLIMVSRTFEAVTNAMSQVDDRQRDSIRTLGPTS
jgi:flagellar basal-body rod protein FlgF